jgi:hypothetical protein
MSGALISFGSARRSTDPVVSELELILPLTAFELVKVSNFLNCRDILPSDML